MKKKSKQILLASVVTLTAIGMIICLSFYNGIIWFNNPSPETYPVRGVDVSAYQGTIDWEVLSSQNIDFAFIKATEGSSFEDPCFRFNWDRASQTNLKVGAYHFFSFDSSGESQANFFIDTVPITYNSLSPVVDIELYGEKKKNPPDVKTTQIELAALLTKLESHYHRKPILYATQKSYDLYLKGKYESHPIWIRDVLTKPQLPDNREWTFWQYSHREKLKGYDGEETYIDMNVFNGTQEEFKNFIQDSSIKAAENI